MAMSHHTCYSQVGMIFINSNIIFQYQYSNSNIQFYHYCHRHESPHLLHTGGNDWRKHGAVFIRVVDVFLTSESFWGPIVVSFARVSKHFLFIAFWIILLMLMIWLSRPKTICEYIKCKVYDSSYSDSQINYLWVMSIDWVTQQRKAIAAFNYKLCKIRTTPIAKGHNGCFSGKSSIQPEVWYLK